MKRPQLSLSIDRQAFDILKRSRLVINSQDIDRVEKLRMLTKNLEDFQRVIGVISKMKDGSKILRMAKVLIDRLDDSNQEKGAVWAAQVALNRALELGESIQKQASQKEDLLDTLVVQAKNDERAYARLDANQAVERAWRDYFDLLLRGGASRDELSLIKRLYESSVKRNAIKQVAQIWEEEESDPYLNDF